MLFNCFLSNLFQLYCKRVAVLYGLHFSTHLEAIHMALMGLNVPFPLPSVLEKKKKQA